MGEGMVELYRITKDILRHLRPARCSYIPSGNRPDRRRYAVGDIVTYFPDPIRRICSNYLPLLWAGGVTNELRLPVRVPLPLRGNVRVKQVACRGML